MSTHLVFEDQAIIDALMGAGANEKSAKSQLKSMKSKATTIKTGGGGNVAKTETGRLCALYTTNVQTGTDSQGKAKFSRKLNVQNAEVISYSRKMGKEDTRRIGKLLSGSFSGQAKAHGTVNADKDNNGASPFITPRGYDIAIAQSKHWAENAAEILRTEKLKGIERKADVVSTE